jgi:hypothetical protein
MAITSETFYGYPGFTKTSLKGWRTFEGFAARVRMFMRDFPEFNRLIPGQETSDLMIFMAIEYALEDFNTTPPFTGHSLENMPSLSVLMDGVVIRILRSAGMLQSRNRLNYNNGGLTVAVSDKAGDYQSWIASLVNEYERKKREVKISQNIIGGFGFVPSEYSFSNFDLFFY